MNVAKHARATQVTVTVEVDSGTLRLVVADDKVHAVLSNSGALQSRVLTDLGPGVSCQVDKRGIEVGSASDRGVEPSVGRKGKAVLAAAGPLHHEFFDAKPRVHGARVEAEPF